MLINPARRLVPASEPTRGFIAGCSFKRWRYWQIRFRQGLAVAVTNEAKTEPSGAIADGGRDAAGRVVVSEQLGLSDVRILEILIARATPPTSIAIESALLPPASRSLPPRPWPSAARSTASRPS